MWVAAAYEPELDVEAALAELGELGEQARAHGVSDGQSLAGFLAGQCGFKGNRQDYYRVENSCLNWVIEQRLGIPISLAVVYVAVGRHVGLDVYGIGFPGHFMVGVRPTQSAALELIDPFSGLMMSQSDCLQQLDRMASGQAKTAKIANQESYAESLAQQLQGYLQPAGVTQILLRLLENLKQIHLRQKDLARALAVVDYQILVDPHNFDLRMQHEQYLAKSAGRPPGQTKIH